MLTRVAPALCLLVLGATVAGAAPSTAARWRAVATGRGVPDFEAVSVVSANSVWALGVTGKATTVVAQWKGSTLRLLQPFAPSQRAGLTGLAAIANDDVWAVGYRGSPYSGHPLVVRWNGRAWRRIPLPILPGTGTLRDIVAISPTDVWAAGELRADNRLTHLEDIEPLVMRWNGRSWKVYDPASIVAPCKMPSWDPEQGPSPFPCGAGLEAIDATSPTDVWVTGTFETLDFAGYSAVVSHWNGRRWIAAESESTGGTSATDVDAVDPHHAWSLGRFVDEESLDSGDDFVVTRWENGRQHVHVNSSDMDPRGLADIFVGGIAATSKTSFWVVGSRGSGPGHPFLVHGDGYSIRVAHTSLDSLRGASLNSIAAVSRTDIWAAGDHLLAHYSP